MKRSSAGFFLSIFGGLILGKSPRESCEGTASGIILPVGWLATIGTSTKCGNLEYNPTELDCCNNILCDRDTHACCGKFCHILSTTVCCDGTVIDKCSSYNSSCCNKKCYDTRWHLCCGKRLLSRDQCYWYDGECCGDSCYNKRKELCCNGKIIPNCGWPSSCCYDKCYNNVTETCCGGAVLPKCESGLCCGNKCCSVQK